MEDGKIFVCSYTNITILFGNKVSDLIEVEELIFGRYFFRRMAVVNCGGD
jgi:hypothetical protein